MTDKQKQEDEEEDLGLGEGGADERVRELTYEEKSKLKQAVHQKPEPEKPEAPAVYDRKEAKKKLQELRKQKRNGTMPAAAAQFSSKLQESLLDTMSNASTSKEDIMSTISRGLTSDQRKQFKKNKGKMQELLGGIQFPTAPITDEVKKEEEEPQVKDENSRMAKKRLKQKQKKLEKKQLAGPSTSAKIKVVPDPISS